MQNLIVSTVRGPAEPLRYGDAPMTAFYSVGPILEGVGPNVTSAGFPAPFGASLIAQIMQHSTAE